MHRSVCSLVLLVLFSIMAVGCGDDSDDSVSDLDRDEALRYCNRLCAKVSECAPEAASTCDCDTLVPAEPSEEEEEDDCDVTVSQLETCVNAVEDVSCADLLSGGGLPAECQLCEDEEEVGGSGGDFGGTGGDFAGTGGVLDGSGGDLGSGDVDGACADLAACCSSVPDAQASMACTTIADSGMDQICAMTLDSFQSANFCN